MIFGLGVGGVVSAVGDVSDARPVREMLDVVNLVMGVVVVDGVVVVNFVVVCFVVGDLVVDPFGADDADDAGDAR